MTFDAFQRAQSTSKEALDVEVERKQEQLKAVAKILSKAKGIYGLDRLRYEQALLAYEVVELRWLTEHTARVVCWEAGMPDASCEVSNPVSWSSTRAGLQKLLVEYPQHHRNDEVRACLSMIAARTGDRALLTQHTGALLNTSHPRSGPSLDAYLLMGDHHYDLGHYAIAEGLYAKAQAFGAPWVQQYVRYRLAWLAYRRGDVEKARQGLSGLVEGDSAVSTAALERIQKELAWWGAQ